MRPLIAITADNLDNSRSSGRYDAPIGYAHALTLAGAAAVILPHEVEAIPTYLARCDGVILSGGVDPRTEAFGEPTHPRARPMDPTRQAFELALLTALDARRGLPVLGVCLGMQMMALHAGGALHQHLPDVLASAAGHQGGAEHAVTRLHDRSVLPGGGRVRSYHQQAVRDAGRLRVVAVAEDEVIEAIDDPARPFYLGVQWHPERGGDPAVSRDLFSAFVAAATR